MVKTEFDIEMASAGVDDHMYIFVTDSNFSESVREFVINKTRLNPAAFKVIVIDDIPKNDAGKTLYKELSKYYQN
jgi:translation initiation factor 2B subunit (eIF-2B alpha/beta/delta family)